MVAGLRLLKAWAAAARWRRRPTRRWKLVAAPPARRIAAQQSRIFAPEFVNPAHVRDTFDVVHAALGEQRLLELDYSDAQQRITERAVQPLGLFFWGNAWLLAARARRARTTAASRLDRCRAIRMLEARFHETPERSLNGFLRAVQASGG